jgi:hypothetical protein
MNKKTSRLVDLFGFQTNSAEMQKGKFGLPFVMCLAVLLSLVALDGRAQTTSTIEGIVSDKTGLPIAGAEVRIHNEVLAIDRTTKTDTNGQYRLTALPANTYNMTISNAGFTKVSFRDLEVTLNRTVTINVTLQVAAVENTLVVQGEMPLLETSTSSSGVTIVPQQIVDMPINGRNYLDLLQLVPGVALNRQANQGSDNAVPVLGERGGNTQFLIDGLGNTDEVGGGPGGQFNQETIAEFQVITTGYKAEFGHASGGVVNVITRSGTNSWHGVAATFHRNSVFDSSNTSSTGMISNSGTPFLLRWDPSFTLGGPVLKDRIFFFGSIERIKEDRSLNFVAPPNIPTLILQREAGFNKYNTTHETRGFVKLEEQFGRHRLSEELNLTNSHVTDFLPLSQQFNLPSTRLNFDNRHLFLGFSDTVLLGDQGSPFVLTLKGQYRGEPSASRAAHPEAGPSTLWFIFSSFTTGGLLGDLGQVQFGADVTPSNLDQKYGSFSANVAKDIGRHNWKFGYDYIRTNVDGVEGSRVYNQLFATLDDFATFGPVNSGLFNLTTTGALTPAASAIHLRNNYSGLYIQDDWRIASKLTLNLGLRWDYDSKFVTKKDFSPRLGFAWQVRPRTVLRGSYGFFYDHFRLGIARDVPQFGGADIRTFSPVSFPRLFYGIPTIATDTVGLCLSQTLTDAQIAAMGLTCTFAGYPPGAPIYGVDHLSSVVAPGHGPIPANAVVTLDNLQMLTGLSPQQFADQSSMAIGQAPGFFFWGPFGTLTWAVFGPAGAFPVTIDPKFATPYTRSFTIGLQQQFANEWTVGLDYVRKDIRNILGVRLTNLPFADRLPNNAFSGTAVNGYGPWYKGQYDAAIFSFTKRLSHRFTFGGSYTFTHGVDDAFCSNLNINIVRSPCIPEDNFVGIPPVVTDPISGQTNANSSFVASNLNFVPQAGKFYDGPNLDKGPSDLALAHTFEAHGLVEMPWGFEISSIFRIQSGFHYSRQPLELVDEDGDLNYNLVDYQAGRNHFTAPRFTNMDLRISKKFSITDRVKLQTLFEFFNLFNGANPAATQIQQNIQNSPFGAVTQVLPGREGQIGIRIEF